MQSVPEPSYLCHMKFLLIALITIAPPSLFAAADSAHEVRPLLIGSTPASFELVDQAAITKSFSEITNGKPSIVIFYRGGWCPFCNKHLQEISRIEKDLIGLGYQIIGISPDSPEKLNQMDEDIEVDYQLYSDSDFKGADAFGISYKLSPKTTQRYLGSGKQLKMEDGQALLPLPSVYVLNTENQVTFSYVNPDIRFRISSDLLLSAAKAGLRYHVK